MEIKPQYVFDQQVNDTTGYSLVRIEEDIEIHEVEDSEDAGNNEYPEVEIIAIGNVISAEAADDIWGEKANLIYIVENPRREADTLGGGVRRFEPLKHFTGLFRTFVETPLTPSGYLGFARKFGLLTVRDDSDLSFEQLVVPELYDEDTIVSGEGLIGWFEQGWLMGEAVKLWDLARAQDAKGLSRYLRWTKGVLGYWTDYQGMKPEFSLIYDTRSPAGRALNFREGDVIAPALFLAATIANLGLEGRVSPQLEMTIDDMTPRLAIRPLNLLGAMWLQLARAIDGDKEYRACQHCGEWFEIGSSGHSRARRFCSNRCRVASSRARKKAQEKSP